MKATSGVNDEILALPKGGGAVQPIGTTFDVDLNTGTGSFTIPLELPTGPNGIRPDLSLRYSSGAGDGMFGMGWTFGLLAVTRRTDLAVPSYDDTDTFALAGNENLVATGNGTYRPVTDTLHWLIEQQDPGWLLTDTTDQVYRLGFSSAGRVASAATGTEQVGSWLLESMTDAFGNAVTYSWITQSTQRYLDSIHWGSYTLGFRYEERPDRLLDGRFGFLVATTRRCAQIALSVAGIADPIVRTWDLTYDDNSGTGRSHLASVTVTGHGPDATALRGATTTFGYAAKGPTRLTRFTGIQPPSLSSGTVELVDFDGDGLPDALELSAGNAWLWPNRGNCTWGFPTPLTQLPAPYQYQRGAVTFADMTGSGTADLVVATGLMSGYYPLEPGTGFGPPHIWRRTPPAALSAAGTRLVDLDGTGKISLLAPDARAIMRFRLDDDREWSDQPELLQRPGEPALDLRDPHVTLADMTGDGIQDLVRVDGSGVVFYPGLGRGRWGTAVPMTPSPRLPRSYDPQRMYLVDVDGDGCADLLYVDSNQVLVWFNTGAGRLSAPTVISATPSSVTGQIRLADMNGDGTVGVLFTAGAPSYGGRQPWLFLDLTGGVKPHLLTSIDDHLGLRTVIGYQPSTHYSELDRAAGQPWGTFHPFPVHCVDFVTRADASTGLAATTTYRYHDGRYDPASRAFLGFGQVDSDVIGDATSPTTRTVTTFHLGLDPAAPNRVLSSDERLRLGALRRRVLSTTVYGLDGSTQASQPYSIVRHSYDTTVQPALSGQSVVVPFLRQTREQTWERGPAVYATRQIDYLDVDAHGNVTSQRNQVLRAGQATPDQDITTTTTFATGGTNIIAAPVRVTQADSTGAIVSAIVTYYDGPDFQGLPEGQISLGAVTRIEELVLTATLARTAFGADQPDWPALSYHHLGDSNWWATRCSYSRSGGPGSTTVVTRGPRGGHSTVVTDPTGQFIRSVTDAVGNTVTASEDPRTSQTAHVADPNGQVTADLFDSLGRVTATIGPGDTAALPSVSYDYRTAQVPTRIGTSKRITSGLAPVLQTYQYVDGFGQPLAQFAPGEGDAGRTWIVTGACTRSSKGEVASMTLPYYTDQLEWAEPPSGTIAVERRYDALGRVIYQRMPGISITTWTYQPGQITVGRGPDGGTPVPVEMHTLDGLGRMTAVARADGNRWVQARYGYDDANRMVSAQSPDGALTRMVYDLRGGLLQQAGVDTGVTRTVIDAAHNAVERRLPTGQTVTTTVDAINRVTSVRDSASPDPAVTYAYLDSGAPVPEDGAQNRIGRLYAVTDALGRIAFSYDPAGRPAGSVRTVTVGGGGTFATSTAYDQLGRATSVTLPAASAGANPTVISYRYNARGLLSGATDLVSAVEHDVAGRVTRLVYDNGTENLATFDPVTGRMTRQQVLAADGSTLRDQTLSFDTDGNLAGVASPIADDAVQYQYDKLNRLVAAQYGSGAAYSYAYSDGGNITHIDGVGGLGYGPAAGSAAVTSAEGSAYTYDAAGRIARAPYGTLTFDALDNLRSVAIPDGGGTIGYSYDFRGQRVVTTENGAVVALSATTNLEFQGGVAILWLPFGDARVAAVSQGKRVFLHPDLSGSPTLFTDDTGRLIRRITFGPYGAMRSDSNPPAVPPVGTGLICLGRRWYDPRLGRFISPDPLVAGVFTIDAWNPYIYAHNNPIAFLDPTGCSFWDVLAIIGVAVVVVALLAAAVFTGGTTIPVAGVVINVSVGLMAATAVGVAGGAVVGGIAAARAGGSIAAGVLLGGLLGGIGAFTGGTLGALAGGEFAHGALLGYVATGVVQGAIAGAATGAAVGFAGGKGSAEQILLAMAKGAAWGALTGAALGTATHFIFGVNPVTAANPNGSPDNYVGITASKWDPSAAAAAGLDSKAAANYVDQYAGAGFDYASEVGDISRSGLSGFNENGITEWVSTGYVPGGSGGFEWTAPGSFSGFNLGGVLIGRGGMLIAIPIGWVPQAIMSAGAITSAVNLSMVLDYTGTKSYADQLVFLGNAVPILDLALGALEEFRYGFWENGKQHFSAVFSSNPDPPPPPTP